MNTDAPKPNGKVRHCPYCGDDMGFIETRYYDRTDPCRKQQCNRDARDVYQSERDEAHERVDDDYRGGW